MKKLTLMSVLGMLLPLFSLKAQQIKPLKIGDTLPDLILHNVINYKDSVIRLSDFKDKLVILDFWATWCTSCIAHFKELYLQQKKHKDAFEVLLVNTKYTRDNQNKIRHFFQNRKRDYVLPCIYGDTALNSLFPHTVIPHFIWIKDKKVIAITDGKYLTEKNILNAALLFPKRNFSLPLKTDPNESFEQKYTSLWDYKGQLFPDSFPAMLWSGKMDGAPTGSVTRSINDSLLQLSFFNCSPREIITTLYRESLEGIPQNRIYIKKETARKDSPLLQEDSVYNIEFLARTYSIDTLYAMARQLFARYLGEVPFSIDSVKVKSLVISGKIREKYWSRSGQRQGETNLWEDGSSVKFYRNLTLETLITYLNTKGKLPVLNETLDSNRRINLELPPNPLNETALIDALRRQGFHTKYLKIKLPFVQLRLN